MRTRLVVLEGSDVYERHAQAWDELLDRTKCPSYFLRSEWLASWARHFGGDKRLFLLVAERAGVWIGGLPIVLGVGRVGGRWRVRKLEVAGFPWFDRIDLPAATREECKETLRLILEWARDDPHWLAFALHEVPSTSPTLHAMRELADELRFPLFTQLVSVAPMIDLETGGWLRPDYKRKLRRWRERFEKMGGAIEMCFQRLEPGDTERMLPEFQRVEQESWKGDQGVGVFRPGKAYDFFREVFLTLEPEGGLAWATLKQGERLLSYHWGYCFNGRFLSYNKAQLPEVNVYRAGHLLLKHMVDQGRELGLHWIDTSRGSLAHPDITRRYHGPVRFHGVAVLYSSGLRGAALKTVRHHVLPAIRWMLGKPGPPRLPEMSPE